MLKIINNIQKYLLITLFFCLPLINAHFFDLIGIKWGFYVNGNYEFSKVIFFNIFSGIIFIFFLFGKIFEKILYKTEYQKIIIPKILFLLTGIILISTFLSDFFYTSLLGNASKSHSALMFINLIGLFTVFVNSTNKIKKLLIKTSIFSLFFVIILGFKEYYYPTFNYGDLQNRAFSTFGHPNYLALFILILMPFLLKKIKQNYIYLIIFILSMFCLLLTKSAWGILIFTSYIIIKNITQIISSSKIKGTNFNTKKIIWNKILGGGLIIILLILFLLNFGLITKLHSFLSRFFIWETTINIIFSDIKNIIFGTGLGTLSYIFDSLKSEYLYIFENFGFTADRPHNLILNYFYHFGIFGLFFIIYLFGKIIKNNNFSKNENKIYYESLFLFFLFTIFNFPSISHYLIILLIGSIIYIKKDIIQKKYDNILTGIILIFTIFGIYFSINYYIEEHKIYKNSSYNSNYTLYNKIKSENFEQNLFGKKFTNIQNMCIDLIGYSKSVENYFYCGDLLWDIDKNLAENYYNLGLSKLPDLRNLDSKYNNYYLIKKFVDKKRFFSKKYSNLEEILERVGTLKN